MTLLTKVAWLAGHLETKDLFKLWKLKQQNHLKFIFNYFFNERWMFRTTAYLTNLFLSLSRFQSFPRKDLDSSRLPIEWLLQAPLKKQIKLITNWEILKKKIAVSQFTHCSWWCKQHPITYLISLFKGPKMAMFTEDGQQNYSNQSPANKFNYDNILVIIMTLLW